MVQGYYYASNQVEYKPTVVLVCIVDMVLRVALPAIKVHLPAKQLVLILSALLLLLINGIKPQVETGEMIIHVLIKVHSIKTRGARLSATPSHRGSIHLLLKGYHSRTTRNIKSTHMASTTTTNIATIITNIPT